MEKMSIELISVVERGGEVNARLRAGMGICERQLEQRLSSAGGRATPQLPVLDGGRQSW
jgi:hypothetical protein